MIIMLPTEKAFQFPTKYFNFPQNKDSLKCLQL